MATDARHLRLALGALDEQYVGAGLGVGLSALQRLVETVTGACVCAGDEQEVGRGPAGRRDLELFDHLFGWHHPSAGCVPTALGEYLVLDLDCGRAGALVAANRALDIEEAAEPGIGVA